MVMAPPAPPAVSPTHAAASSFPLGKLARKLMWFLVAAIVAALLTSADDPTDWFAVKWLREHFLTAGSTPPPTPTPGSISVNGDGNAVGDGNIVINGNGNSITVAPPSSPSSSATAITTSTTTDTSPTTTTPADVAKSPLGDQNGTSATAFFGQISAVMATRSDVSFNLQPRTPTTPQGCALTVTFDHVSGTTAPVWASGFDYEAAGWTTPEAAPDQGVATDNGVVHHQLLIPPKNIEPGFEIHGSGFMQVDDQTRIDALGTYDLKLEAVEGDMQQWSFDGTPVICSTWPS